MAIRTKDELIKAVADFLGDSPDETGLTLLEDISDTVADMSAAAQHDWRQKYEDNDRQWRARYKQRFTQGSDAQIENVDEGGNEVVEEHPLRYEDLFKEG